MDVTRLGPVRFCHATTRSDTEIVLVDSPVERYGAAFADTDEPTVVLGHTHLLPLDRLHAVGSSIPGSVGMRYGSQGALWALIGPDVALRAHRLRSRPSRQRFVHRNIQGWPNLSRKR